jgi:AraC-like DNA-binding protein
MSLSKDDWAKMGAYSSPFSSNGMEFFPLGVLPDHSGFVLHESGFMSKRPHWNYPNVMSPFWRLYYDPQRGHKVVFPDKKVALGPDKIVIIPDNLLFHAVGTRPIAKFWLAFNCNRRPAPCQPIPIQLEPSSMELGIIQELQALFLSENPEKHRTRIFNYSMALLNVTFSRPEIEWHSGKPVMISQAIEHIQTHYDKPLYNRDLARLSSLSETAFNRLFRAYQGISPAQFIMQIRVREAAILLLNTGLSLEEIAEKCGFPNRAYFSRVFRQITGESPARVRCLLGGKSAKFSGAS